VGGPGEQVQVSRYVEFSRADWARLRDQTPLPLSEAQLRPLGGLIEPVSLDEVVDVYLPLSRLLNLYVGATQQRHQATSTFLGSDQLRVPYVIGVAGQCRRGEEHDLAPHADAALALARPPAGGSRDDRRISASPAGA
jgi:type I pantothenate kinase